MAPLVARYVDCAREAGINFTATNARSPRKYLIETMGSGCGFIDYDRDGFLDILLLNGRPLPGTPVTGHPTLKLYHNNGNGTFTDVTHKAGLDIPMFAMGCAAGDYDNDGYDDIYISCALGDGHLFHNDGNGHFTDVTRRAGVGDGGRWGTSCAWVDVDSDGYLDLFVCNYVKYRTLKDDIPCFGPGGKRTYCGPTEFTASHCALFHNNRNGTFTDISKSSGIGALPAKGLGVAIWDYDHDGRPDIFVANDGMPGFLLHNLGGCKFEDLGIRSGLAYDDSGNYHSGMGIDAGDIDGSGGTSVVVTNFSEQQTSLYRETSTGIFRDVRISSGVGPPSQDTLGFATFFLDYANEGFPGIFVLNGHVQDDIAGLQPGVTYAEPPFLFHNQRDGTFVNVAPISGGPLAGKIVGRSAAWGDFDNDGKLDILVTTSGGKAELWHNVTPNTGHWIGLRLIGTKSNRDGIGAVVTARAGNRTSTIAVRSGSSYLSSSDLRAHLGLGGATSAEVTVTWPSGIVDHIASIPAGSYYNLVEGEGKVSPCLARVKPA